jgi:anaerobic carbon-monoxide dehydrogenase iron sulfur subunit
MKKIIRIRNERCTGCRVCELTCSFGKEGVFIPQKSRVKIYHNRERGLDIISLCQMCDPAPCLKVCKPGALSRNTNQGNILLDIEMCTKKTCLKCLAVCPYNAIGWNPDTQEILICDLCNGDPECVKHCKPRAIVFENCERSEILQQMKELKKNLNGLNPSVA